MTIKNNNVKNNPEKIINIMGVSELLTGKKRNITGYMLKNGKVSSANTEKINQLYDIVSDWIDSVLPECDCIEFYGTKDGRCINCNKKIRS